MGEEEDEKMIYIDPRKKELLVCSCGHTETTITRVCIICGILNKMIRYVSCADLYHNEPCGCQNPECWKYHPITS